MKVPKEKRRYCPHCKKHAVHKVAAAKKKGQRSLVQGSKYRARRRGKGRGYGNLGKYGSRPAITKWKSTGKKSSKRTDLRYKCKDCNKTHPQRYGIRTKRLEFK